MSWIPHKNDFKGNLQHDRNRSRIRFSRCHRLSDAEGTFLNKWIFNIRLKLLLFFDRVFIKRERPVNGPTFSISADHFTFSVGLFIWFSGRVSDKNGPNNSQQLSISKKETNDCFNLPFRPSPTDRRISIREKSFETRFFFCCNFFFLLLKFIRAFIECTTRTKNMNFIDFPRENVYTVSSFNSR
jgi:hypothetical protein